MPPREPQPTPPKTFAINSSRDMLEKLRREIECLARSIIRQEVVDHGLNAAMTAWHLTDWTWKEIKDSPRLRSLATRAGTPIRELKQFQEFVKRDLHRVGVLRRGRRLNETFRLLEGPSVFHQGNIPIQNKSAPDWQRSGAKLHKFSPIGESISYTAKQLNRSIRSRPSGKIGLVSELIMKCIQLLNVRARCLLAASSSRRRAAIPPEISVAGVSFQRRPAMPFGGSCVTHQWQRGREPRLNAFAQIAWRGFPSVGALPNVLTCGQNDGPERSDR